MTLLTVFILIITFVTLIGVSYILFSLRSLRCSDGELRDEDLTPEQRAILEKLNAHQKEILQEFDKVLRKFEIPRQVYRFSLTPKRDDSKLPTMWCCCANPPPKEAPCGDCPKKRIAAVPPGGSGSVD